MSFLLACNALLLMLFVVALQTVAEMALHIMNADGIYRYKCVVDKFGDGFNLAIW